MAHFIGYLNGSAAGEASRIGSAKSGIDARAQGWNVGVRVSGRVVDGEDVFEVFATGGSNASCYERHIGTVRRPEAKDDPVVKLDERHPAIAALRNLLAALGREAESHCKGDVVEKVKSLGRLNDCVREARGILDALAKTPC